MIINFYRDIPVTEWAYITQTNTKFFDKYSSKNILVQNWLLYCTIFVCTCMVYFRVVLQFHPTMR